MSTILQRLLGRPVSFIHNGFLAKTTQAERLLADQLRREAATVCISLGEAETVWNENYGRICRLINRKDPRGFLQWDVVLETMFFAHGTFTAVELKYLKSREDWDTVWQNAIVEDKHGRPLRYFGHPKSSGNLIHHAYHLCKFQETTGVKTDEISGVFEFGGGYGSMCRLWWHLGFRGGYVVFDLPPFSALQRYYLNHPNIMPVSPEKAGAQEISCQLTLTSDLTQVPAGISTLGENALFLATWSLSETPLLLRERLHKNLRWFRYYLIAFQHAFSAIDNLAYFRKLRAELGDHIIWREIVIEHMPGNSYLFGVRSDDGAAREQR